MSESESSDDDTFSTSKLRAYLKSLRSQIDDVLESLEDPGDLFTKQYRLNPSAQSFFNEQSLSVQEMFNLLLHKWKEEGRLGVSGKTIRLSDSEAALFKKKPGISVSIYDCIRYLSRLQNV
jgi:hypothetical protein